MNPVRVFALALALSSASGSAEAAASGWVGDDRAAMRLVTAAEGTGSEPSFDAGLQFRLGPGWHTYWRTPGDAGIAPKIDWTGSENVGGVAIAWPAPKRHVQAGLRSNVYDASVTLPLRVTPTRPGAPIRLRATVDFAGCATICIPYHGSLSLDLGGGPAGPSVEAGLIVESRGRVPVSLEAAGIEIARTAQPERPGSRLTILVRSRAALFVRPDIFVEQGTESVAATVQTAEGGAAAWVHVSPQLPEDGPARPLTLTLVDGARAAEWSIGAPPQR